MRPWSVISFLTILFVHGARESAGLGAVERDRGARIHRTWSLWSFTAAHPTVKPLVDVVGSHARDSATASAVRRMIRRGEVHVNGAPGRASMLVYSGDVVEHVQRSAPGKFRRDMEKAKRLPVLFEDDHIAIVVKPAGMPTHAGDSGNRGRESVRSLLLHALEPTCALEAPLRRPMHVHRLDAATTGLLVCAKTRPALTSLSAHFAARRVKKRYVAIVKGRLVGSGVVELPLDGAAAETRWRAVQHVRSLAHGWLTLVDVFPKTGRKHQIRRHLDALGHSILGDRLYGARKGATTGTGRSGEGGSGRNQSESGGSVAGSASHGMFLAAIEIAFPHPHPIPVEGNEEMHQAIDVPKKFTKFLAKEAARWGKFHEGPIERGVDVDVEAGCA